MIEYTVIRTKRKTLAVEVTAEGKVLVRSPLRLGEARINEFVAKHENWIISHVQKAKERMASKPDASKIDAEALRMRALEIIPPRVAHYSSLMKLYPTGIKITSAKSQTQSEYACVLTSNRGVSRFADVADTDWYAQPVTWAMENKVTSGIGNGNFGPDQVCTRAQVVTFLSKVYGKNTGHIPLPSIKPVPIPTFPPVPVPTPTVIPVPVPITPKPVIK